MKKHGAQIWTCARACVTVRTVDQDRSLRGCGTCATTRPPVAAGGQSRFMTA